MFISKVLNVGNERVPPLSNVAVHGEEGSLVAVVMWRAFKLSQRSKFNNNG